GGPALGGHPPAAQGLLAGEGEGHVPARGVGGEVLPGRARARRGGKDLGEKMGLRGGARGGELKPARRARRGLGPPTAVGRAGRRAGRWGWAGGGAARSGVRGQASTATRAAPGLPSGSSTRPATVIV